MTVEVLADRAKWDEFVDKSPYSMLFHKWDFLKIAEKHTGYTLHPYGIFKGSELIALFPVFTKKYMGMGMAYSPPPRSGIPYLGLVPGPQFDSVKQPRREAYFKQVVQDLNAELSKNSVRYTYFSLVPGIADIREFLWNGYDQNIKFTYTLDLKRPIEDLWKDMDARARAQVKKEAFAIEQRNDVGTFYRIMDDRYSQQDLKFPLAGEKYIDDLLDVFPDNVKMFVACRKGEVINADIHCMYKDTYLEWMGGVNLQRDSRSSEYMRWHCIQEAKAQGYRTYEIYGADVMRICQNKNKFNPALDCTYTVQKKMFAGAIAESLYRAASALRII